MRSILVAICLVPAYSATAQATGTGDGAVCMPRTGSPVGGEIIGVHGDTLVLASNLRTSAIALSSLRRVDMFPIDKHGAVLLSMFGGTCVGLQLVKGEWMRGEDFLKTVGALGVGALAGWITAGLRPPQPMPSSMNLGTKPSSGAPDDVMDALRDRLHAGAADRLRFRAAATIAVAPIGAAAGDALNASVRNAGMNTGGYGYTADEYEPFGSARSFVAPLRSLQLSVLLPRGVEAGITFVDIASSTLFSTDSADVRASAAGYAVMAYGGVTHMLARWNGMPVYGSGGVGLGIAPVRVDRYVFTNGWADHPTSTLFAAQARASVQILVGGALLLGAGFDFLLTSQMSLPEYYEIRLLPMHVLFGNAAFTLTVGAQL